MTSPVVADSSNASAVIPVPDDSSDSKTVTQENGRPIFGVYVGNNMKDVTQYDEWLGKSADAILGYTGDANESDFRGSLPWGMGVFSQVHRRVLWSVSLIPKGATLAEAAGGKYNPDYKKMAQLLAAWRPQDKFIYVRTAWEFNGNWFHYNAQKDPENFIASWRQFVTTFRSVSPRFRFDWCPAGCDSFPITEKAYPGDDYVDIIGLDVYDEVRWHKISDPVKRFNERQLNGPYGLIWHRDFAKQHHKAMSYPEWGSCGNDVGDNSSYFIEQMYKWFIENHVIYATYWNSNSSYQGKLSENQYPKAGQKYRELFNPKAE